jgi:hypothetical protein
VKSDISIIISNYDSNNNKHSSKAKINEFLNACSFIHLEIDNISIAETLSSIY